jgi:hypothetical protein
MLPQSVAKPPWLRVIVVKPGCEEEIKEAGVEASKKPIEVPLLSNETTIDPTLTHCRQYPEKPIKQERA